MNIVFNMTPFEYLMKHSHECEYLKDIIIEAIQAKKITPDKFNSIVDAFFIDEEPTQTALNDFMRFEYQTILNHLDLEKNV